MSDDSGATDPGGDDLSEDIVPLAEEYLELVARQENDPEADADQKELDQLREEIEEWGREIDGLNEGDELHEIAVEEKESLEARLAEREREDTRRERVGQRFLDRISSEFVARDDWLHPSVIRAITHAIIGEEREEILLDESRLPDDELDNRAIFDLSQNVRALVISGEEDTKLADLWEDIEGTRQHQILEVLARSPEPLGPTDIAERIDDAEVNGKQISARLSDARESKYIPFYRADGDYQLSLVGEFLWREFGSGDGSEDEVSSDSDSDLSDF